MRFFKVLFLLIGVLSFSSCTKAEPETADPTQKTYYQVIENIESEVILPGGAGERTYSYEIDIYNPIDKATKKAKFKIEPYVLKFIDNSIFMYQFIKTSKFEQAYSAVYGDEFVSTLKENCDYNIIDDNIVTKNASDNKGILINYSISLNIGEIVLENPQKKEILRFVTEKFAKENKYTIKRVIGNA